MAIETHPPDPSGQGLTPNAPGGTDVSNDELAKLLEEETVWEQLASACDVRADPATSRPAKTLKTALGALAFNLRVGGEPSVGYESQAWLGFSQVSNDRSSRHELSKRWKQWSETAAFRIPLSRPGHAAEFRFASAAQEGTSRQVLLLHATIRDRGRVLARPSAGAQPPHRQPSDRFFGQLDRLLENALEDARTRAEELAVNVEVTRPPGWSRESYRVTLTPPTSLLVAASQTALRLGLRVGLYILASTLPAGAVTYRHVRTEAMQSVQPGLTLLLQRANCAYDSRTNRLVAPVIRLNGFTFSEHRPIFVQRREGETGPFTRLTKPLEVTRWTVQAVADPATSQVTGTIRENFSYTDSDVRPGIRYQYALAVDTPLRLETFTQVAGGTVELVPCPAVRPSPGP